MDRLGLYTDRLSDYFLGYRGLDIPSRENIIRHHKGELLETEEFKFVWGKFKTLTNVINGFVMDIISFSAFIIVGLLYVRGEITIGTGIATFGYIESFIYPIKYILNDMNSIHSSRELMKEMEELIEVQGETTEVSEEIGEEIREIRLEGSMIKRGDFCLKNFNYVFEMGKKYGIIGESGTGKTTILSVLAGEVIPDKGRVLVNGKDMTGKMDRVASAYCFFLSQYPHLFRMPYCENVTNFGTYGGEKLAKLERELPSKFVEALKKTESTELSGGEKQVLGLLKGRISGKKVFLLDEVFSAIDKGSTENMKAFIDKEKGEAGIQIEVTHDLTEENLKRFDEVLRL